MDNQNFTFEAAMLKLKGGAKVSRHGWNGSGMYIHAQFPDEHSKMEQPYLYIVPGKELTVPFVLTNRDIFQDDWYEVQ